MFVTLLNLCVDIIDIVDTVDVVDIVDTVDIVLKICRYQGTNLCVASTSSKVARAGPGLAAAEAWWLVWVESITITSSSSSSMCGRATLSWRSSTANTCPISLLASQVYTPASDCRGLLVDSVDIIIVDIVDITVDNIHPPDLHDVLALVLVVADPGPGQRRIVPPPLGLRSGVGLHQGEH